MEEQTREVGGEEGAKVGTVVGVGWGRGEELVGFGGEEEPVWEGAEEEESEEGAAIGRGRKISSGVGRGVVGSVLLHVVED